MKSKRSGKRRPHATVNVSLSAESFSICKIGAPASATVDDEASQQISAFLALFSQSTFFTVGHEVPLLISDPDLEPPSDAPVDRYVWRRHVFLAKPKGLSSFFPAVPQLIVGNDSPDSPIPVGNGAAIGIVPPATLMEVGLSALVGVTDLVVTCLIAWWMSRWGGLCYGGDDVGYEGRGDSQRSPYRFSGTISLADTHGLSIPTSEAPIEAETDAPVERYVWTRHVFLAKPRGLSSFIPAVALSVFVKMVVVLCPVMGAQFLFTWGSHDKKSGTIMFAAGANLAVLGLLLTCRTTVENIRKYKVSAAMIAEDPRHRSRSRARKYLGTAGLEYTPSSGWERVLPCIDWSLLRPGSFGLAFSQIVLVWTASIFFKFILVASALSAFVGVADILEGTLQLVFLSVSLFLFVEKSPIKPHRESMKSAILISLMLCVFYQAARYLFSGLLYLSLARLTYLERTIPIIIVCDTFSLCFCFFLPDIPRLRLVLLRSLAPSIIKPAALFKPQLLYGYKTTVHPSKPPNVEQTSCETIEELDYAGPALVNYGLCLRIICCAVSRTGVFMPFNPERMFKVALTTLIVSWTLTVAIMAWIRSRIGIQIANARSGEKKTW
ncbi:hypothetical protein DFJ73DRAFT_792526, partial [Zopfochytrium polystomum]